MTKQISTKPIEQYSGKSWAQWVHELDRRGARDMAHPTIAKLVMELLQSGWWDVNAQPKLDWWAQGIAIAYEQSVGLRIVGQQSDGMFAATVSKTLAAQTDHVYKAWCTYESAKDHGPARLSQTPKRLYWRADMHDGSKIEAAFESKGDTKTLMTISQTKITDQSLVSSQKAHWTRVMEHFLQEFVKSQ